MSIGGVGNSDYSNNISPSNTGGSNATPAYLTPPASQCESIQNLKTLLDDLKTKNASQDVISRVETHLTDFANEINNTKSQTDQENIEQQVNHYANLVSNLDDPSAASDPMQAKDSIWGDFMHDFKQGW